ncbi:tyrosine-type recombinase/integrase [Vampirovibrio sp.]|uniref:tyrosine-type recombinase/integrase n=1 Tax=Vampirovibrio sp. TaxID=2717857 RepID=UPI00359446A0
MSKEYTLSEAAAITGLKYEKLKVDSRRGLLPTEVRLNGNKPYKVITAETLAKLLQNQEAGGYSDLKAQWRREMLAGTHSGTSTPVSESYLNDLDWGFKKYWRANGGQESIEGLNADGLRLAFAQFQFDEASRRDYYSTKMHIYKAVSSLVQFLIRKGYKTPSVLEEIKQLRPKARVKPQRHSLDLAEVWDALSFNSRWNDGRTTNDIQTMDLLLFLYGFAGLRKMEAANIKISGVDFIKNEILVPGKWGKERLVPMPQELADKLKEWIENLRPESDLPYVMVSNRGNQLSDKSMGSRFTRLSKALALNKAIALIKARETQPGATKETVQYTPEDEIELFFPSRTKEAVLKEAEQLAKTLNCAVRPHDLRRAYAKMLADQGMPLPRIQYVLGHNDIETTMKYINIKQKEATDWIRENFVIALPKKAKPQPVETALSKSTESGPAPEPKQQKKYRY